MKKVFKKILRFFVTFFAIALTFIIIVGAIFAAKFMGEAKNLVNQYRDIRITPQKESTIIYDRNGVELATLFYGENREYAELEEVPQKLYLAFIAVEDRDFFNHRGINPLSVIRAVLHNLTNKSEHGGSTLTQQLARNLYLTKKKTFDRKIREAIISVMIERNFTKQEILESYLNQVYLGNGAYGVKTASEIYFGKNMRDLTLAECALLAGLPQSPSRYDPTLNPDKAIKRRNIVLLAMLNTGFITKEDYERAISEPLKITPFVNTKKAPYFVDWVIRQLVKDYGFKKATSGGLRVYTTLDLGYQEKAETATADALLAAEAQGRNVSQVAIESINPETGAVEVMVGGKDYKASQFNRVMQALRQPGSSFKPFVYITGLKNGLSMKRTMMSDNKVCYQAWKRLWCPRNYKDKEYGTITLEHALMVSNNRIAVKIAVLVGIDAVINTAREMGITTEIPHNLSAALGSCVVKPVEIINAYGILANGGYEIRPYFIEKITDSSGGIIFEAKHNKPKRILPQTITTQMVLAMKRGVAEGTGKAAYVTDQIGRAIAGKTGTTSDFHDAWFIGFTPDMVTGVWIGNDNNMPMTEGTAGGGIPAGAWAEFMISIFASSGRNDSILDFPFATTLPGQMLENLIGEYEPAPNPKAPAATQEAATETVKQ